MKIKNIKPLIQNFTRTRQGIVASFILMLISFVSLNVSAQNKTFSSGAYIIDMGQPTQTINNSLKPYGLVYELIVLEHVPVQWAITPGKIKDGIDFIVNGKNYRGGPFIIPAEFVSSSVLTRINTWKTKGVVVDGPIPAGFTTNVYKELTSWPKAILDDDNGQIVKDYYTNAGLPISTFQLAGTPLELTGCSDIYVLPHADPQNWPASYGTALDNFIKNNKGYLWAGCHAVSAMEGSAYANLPYLSYSPGLVPWGSHNDGTPPYTYNPVYNSDPIMQFIGTLDAATQNGSEQIYFPPKIGGSWRPTTRIAVYDPDHSQANAGTAAVVAYGPAYGNSNYGTVMYEAGHDLAKSSGTANVAAQRAFFNFVLLAGVEKQIDLSSSVPSLIVSGNTISLNVNATGGSSPYTYAWTSSCGGSFTSPSGSSTDFTAPTVSQNTNCVISVTVTDACGRFSYISQSVVISANQGPVAANDDATTPMNTPVDITILSNDLPGSSPLNPGSVTFTGALPNPATQGTFSVNPATGVVTFTPVLGYTGTVNVTYQVCDGNSLCSEALITVVITPVTGPDAKDDQAQTNKNTPVNISVLTNDDPGSSPINPASVTFIAGTEPDASTVGTFTVNSAGLVTFTPVATFVGTTTIDYQVCDQHPVPLCDIAKITVVVVDPVADLEITKTVSPNPVISGQGVIYTIVVKNNGPATAMVTVSTDVLSPNLTFISADPGEGTSWSAPTWNIGTLAPAETVTLTVIATVNNGFTGTINNSAVVSSSTTDPDPANNTANALLTVNPNVPITNIYPATGPGTLAYEDLWPYKGDYDFNDMVIDYQFEIITNPNNMVDQLKCTFTLKAFGAYFHNGFGFQLSQAIQAADLTVTGSNLSSGYINLSGNGSEVGQTKPTIIVFDDAYNLMPHPGQGIGVNTERNAPFVTPVTMQVTIDFKPDTYTYYDLDIANFNPFIIVDKQRSVEVHLPDYPPTSLANMSLLGTGDDKSNPSAGKYYKTANNLPWAINIYESFDYPLEKVDVTGTHLHFVEWAISGGQSFPDWYQDKPGYRNSSNTY